MFGTSKKAIKAILKKQKQKKRKKWFPKKSEDNQHGILYNIFKNGTIQLNEG